MLDWQRRLGTLPGVVTPFDYPYMAAGRRAPDRLPKLLAEHQAQLGRARQRHPELPQVLIGKSMGSRVGCHLAVAEASDEAPAAPPIAALVCLGYPLKAMSKTARVRDEVLLALSTPVLFVQGTRDRMCPLELLDDVRGKMTAPSAVHVVETGNHSLTITKGHTKATGIDQDASDQAVLEAIRSFLDTHAGTTS